MEDVKVLEHVLLLLHCETFEITGASLLVEEVSQLQVVVGRVRKTQQFLLLGGTVHLWVEAYEESAGATHRRVQVLQVQPSDGNCPTLGPYLELLIKFVIYLHTKSKHRDDHTQAKYK